MDSTYWDSIPLWGPDEEFEVMADHLSGRIPVARLEAWQDFSDLLESNFFNSNGVQFIFRGHRRYDWNLPMEEKRRGARRMIVTIKCRNNG